ncbi:hypothetical protein KY366_07320 [Candidatus Woesearchaeota archaeon]|nr:hypothetical protein [Candidatus Woesearchaeota archaeon]
MAGLPERLYYASTESGFLIGLNYLESFIFTPHFVDSCHNAKKYGEDFNRLPLLVVLINPNNFKINEIRGGIYQLETPIQFPDPDNIYLVNICVYEELRESQGSGAEILKKIDPNFLQNNVL